MSVIVDIIEGARARRTTEGTEISRIAHVIGLSGTNAQKVVRALSAQGLPPLGAQHPEEPLATLVSIDLVTIDRDSVQLELLYRTPQDSNITGGGQSDGIVLGVQLTASTVLERTNTDARGRLMTNRYIGPVQNTVGLIIVRKEVELDVFRPQLIVRIAHRRPTIPKQLATDYIGAINADRWNGYAPNTWLCTNFDARREQGTWIVNFEAMFRKQGWRNRDVIKVNGEVPQFAVVGNGIAIHDPYERRRFQPLGLKF